MRANPVPRPCRRLLALALLLGCMPAVPAQEEAPPERKPIYDTTTDGKTLVDQALAVARKENTRVLLSWGGNWCDWCFVLDDLLHTDRTLRRTLLYEYELVNIDLGDFNRNMDLADELGANPEASAPYLTILDASGKAVANREGADFEVGESYDVARLNDFLKENAAPPLGAAEVLEAALQEAREEKKRLLVHLGAPW